MYGHFEKTIHKRYCYVNLNMKTKGTLSLTSVLINSRPTPKTTTQQTLKMGAGRGRVDNTARWTRLRVVGAEEQFYFSAHTYNNCRAYAKPFRFSTIICVQNASRDRAVNTQ